ncbi:hypothetical protein V8C35DRAFT_266158 [Trichoderma chlorosporum]
MQMTGLVLMRVHLQTASTVCTSTVYCKEDGRQLESASELRAEWTRGIIHSPATVCMNRQPRQEGCSWYSGEGCGCIVWRRCCLYLTTPYWSNACSQHRGNAEFCAVHVPCYILAGLESPSGTGAAEKKKEKKKNGGGKGWTRELDPVNSAAATARIQSILHGSFLSRMAFTQKTRLACLRLGPNNLHAVPNIETSLVLFLAGQRHP